MLKVIRYKLHDLREGTSLIDVAVSLGIIVLLFGAIYMVYFSLIDSTTNVGLRTAASEALNRQMEIIRNMPYEQIGVSGGAPAGVILGSQTVKIGDQAFVIEATVRNIDDPFDGTIGGTPNDTAPADYKLVELKATCPTCSKFSSLHITSTVAPKGLESTSSTGSLFVNVFDASGGAVSGATIRVTNTSTTPSIDLTDTTNTNGLLQLVGIPTSTQSYAITVSKSGYSSDKTYLVGAPANPNPLKSHATVANGTVTNVSFSIDKVSVVQVVSSDALCAAVPNIPFSLSGAKIIGTNPNVLKFSTSSQTNSLGVSTFSSIESDTYTATSTPPGVYLVGTVPLVPFIVSPSSTADIRLVFTTSSPNALLVTLTNAITGAGVSSATTTLSALGVSLVQSGGRSSKLYSDWSGVNYSAGEEIDAESIPGSVTMLASASSTYNTSIVGTLTSKTIDLSSSAASYFSFDWNPQAQLAQTTMQFQVAANNDNSTWNFVGPDGTQGTYFTTSSTLTGLNGNRYFRYKAYFSTQDETATPRLNDVTLIFSSPCTPQYHAFFEGLTAGTYTLAVSAPNYAYTTSSVTVGVGWQTVVLPMQPQ